MCGPTDTMFLHYSPMQTTRKELAKLDEEEVMGNKNNSSTMTTTATAAAPRRVTFGTAHVVGTVMSLDDYTKEDVRRCWWSRRDRENIYEHCKHSLYVATPKELKLTNMQGATFESTKSFARKLSNAQVDAVVQHLEEYIATPWAWARMETKYRGLEMHMSSFQRRERSTANKKVRACVVDLHRINAKEVASYYSNKCKTARIFARFMGEADSCAVRQ